ncbi:MAG: helix-turn-helix domain-containing protein [Candidatus Kapaibacteriota bacterium]
MIIQSFPAISPQLRSLVRSFMLMEIEVSQRQHFSQLSVPASDITALLLQLSGQGGYHRHLQTSERVSLEKPYIHGQITNVDYGGAELGSNDNEDIALFGVVFTPTGMQAFVRKNLGGLDQIENTFMSASSIIPHVEVLQEELQETYHQCHRRRTRNKQEAAAFTPFSKLPLLAQRAEKFLLNILNGTNAAPTSLRMERAIQQADYICQRLAATHGKLSIEAIAQETDLSERHTRRILKEFVGASGKTFAEVQRFMYASRLLIQTAQTVPFGETITSEHLHSAIYEAGYYDQSHCIRDFKRFAGCTPLQFLAQRHALGEKIIGA